MPAYWWDKLSLWLNLKSEGTDKIEKSWERNNQSLSKEEWRDGLNRKKKQKTKIKL